MDQDPVQPDRPKSGDAAELPAAPSSHAMHQAPVDEPSTGGPRSGTHEAGPHGSGAHGSGANATGADATGANAPEAHGFGTPEERHRSGNRTITAVVLIIVGAVLLLGRGFGVSLDNWWALFILIPAVAALSRAWSAYQKSGGEITSQVSGQGIAGIVLLVLAGVFLFDLDWSLMGGVVIILIGAGMLMRNRSKG